MRFCDDITRTASSPRRWLAALACVLLLGQSLAVAHALDLEAHADERACELCHVSNQLSGAAPAVGDATGEPPQVAQQVVDQHARGPARIASLLPPSRAPPVHLATL